MRIENHFNVNSFALGLALKQRLGVTRKWSLYYHETIQVQYHSVFVTFASVDQNTMVCSLSFRVRRLRRVVFRTEGVKTTRSNRQKFRVYGVTIQMKPF